MDSRQCAHLLGAALKAQEKCNEASVEMGLPPFIDEISLLFATQADLLAFRDAAVAIGADNFNSVTKDLMRREDEAGDFHVRFEFLRISLTWRIEAMAVMWGTAPLHQAMLRETGGGCVMHASYKLPSEEMYFEHIGALAQYPETFRASYRNSYGRFSYWKFEDLPYFKPRVNLRDRPLAEESGRA
jgi:hypothetical protein